jgi:hypothetical protein
MTTMTVTELRAQIDAAKELGDGHLRAGLMRRGRRVPCAPVTSMSSAIVAKIGVTNFIHPASNRALMELGRPRTFPNLPPMKSGAGFKESGKKAWKVGQIMPPLVAPPSEAENRTALERVLAGTAFINAPMLSVFFRFVVEAALTGRPLKGYTIAVEALGRRSSFDPASDAVVIELPRGQYVPTFCHRHSADTSSEVAIIDLVRPSNAVDMCRLLLETMSDKHVAIASEIASIRETIGRSRVLLARA